MSEETEVRMIKLADGTLINPETREPINKPVVKPAKPSKVEEPEDDDDEDEDDELSIVPSARRSIMDLSLDKKQMAFINNVLVYTLWGLPDDEIAIQCNCAIEQVEFVRDLDDYRRMHDALIGGIRDAFMSTVQGIIHDAAPKAARGMVKGLKSKHADIKHSSQKDILDRAGHRPSDRVEHIHSIDTGSELVIRVIRQSDDDNIPTLELDANA